MMRAQIAMWILTKFAMLFFIGALFTLIFMFQQTEKSRVCDTQVNKIALGISGRLQQIISSPVEDEQRSFVFPLGIELGRDDLARYRVNITKHEQTGSAGTGRIVIEVIPAAIKNCVGVSRVDYANYEVNLYSIDERKTTITKPSYKQEIIQLDPSNRDESKKSFYLVAIKCGEKVYQGRKYIFIQDCQQQDPTKCFDLVTNTEVNDKCGFA